MKYPTEEVRKIDRGYRYSAAQNEAKEFVETYSPDVVLLAVEFCEKQSGASFWELPLRFRQKLEEAIVTKLSREVYPRALDALVQTKELIVAMQERAAFVAFNDALERTRAAFNDIEPSLSRLLLPPPLKTIGGYPVGEIGQISPGRSGGLDHEAKQFAEEHAPEARMTVHQLFREQNEGFFSDLPPLFHEKFEEALRERLSCEVYARVTEVIEETREFVTVLLERAAVEAFDEAFAEPNAERKH